MNLKPIWIILMLLAFSANAAEDCDIRLYHRVSQAVARLVPEVLSAEMVEQMASSAAPFDPTLTHAPTPRNLAAQEFFRTSFARLSPDEWSAIRRELAEIVHAARGLQEVSRQSERKTQDILAMTTLHTLPVLETDVRDWRVARDGHIYFLHERKTRARVEVFELEDSRPKWEDDKLTVQAAALGLDANGDAVVTDALEIRGVTSARIVLMQTRLRDGAKTQKEFVAKVGGIQKLVSSERGIEVLSFESGQIYGFGDKAIEFPEAKSMTVVKSAVDIHGNPVIVLLKRGSNEPQVFRVARFDGKTWQFIDGGPTPTISNDPREFALYPLKDGRMLQVWNDHKTESVKARIQDGPPVDLLSNQVVFSVEALETASGRIFVAARVYDSYGRRLKIVELGNPEFAFRRDDSEQSFVRLFERNGQFYAVALKDEAIEVFEPLSGTEPVIREEQVTTYGHFALQTTPQGQVFLLAPLNMGESQVYSLFTRSR